MTTSVGRSSRQAHDRQPARALQACHTDSAPDEPSTSQPSSSTTRNTYVQSYSSRRSAILLLASSACLAAGGATSAPQAQASKLPAFADSAWEALGGGPSDLVFPDSFLGVWDVSSVLVSVDTPLGEEAVPNPAAVQRARREDLNHPTAYQVSFVRNGSGRVVYDRRFNTASMLAMYYDGTLTFDQRIDWDVDDPNVLSLTMPKGMSVRTRVTRRSEEFPTPDRIETSEYVESVYEEGEGGAPRVKASQCFTKYKWRSQEAADRDGGPVIVATQVVSDYLTALDGEQRFLTAMGKPYAQYTYRMGFRRAAAQR